MDLYPLLIWEAERAAAKRYADALEGKALAFRRWELAAPGYVGRINYLFAVMIAVMSDVLAATMAESGLRFGTTDGEVAFLFAVMFGGPLALAFGTWVWRGLALWKLALLEMLDRLPEEQAIVDDPVESLTHRVVRVADAFNVDAERLRLERDGVAVGDLAPNPGRDARAQRLARLRPALETCLTRMRFWRHPMMRSVEGVRPSPADTSDLDGVERELRPAALARA